ncbi:33646_t:CDS:2 [Gigaspora margarita]|uniref:33646_t:CDS:1 n=1 Tax=Gigaspora margarita TaxID=4874 RepID=A0ABM8VXL1_GIGMA|nr:33646_t:CDS:2 [Gigaspora margarita]
MVGFSKGSACPTCGRSGGDKGYLDLQKLLHKKQAPDADNKLELSEKLEDGTGIFFLLYKLKCLWIYTNRLLCQAPYSGAIKARWTRANYIYDETANDVEELVKKYLKEYTYTDERLRDKVYAEEYLNEVNKVVDEFDEKEPLKSHIFCPTEGDVGKSEDYAFDHFKLIDHKAGVSDADYKLYLERVSRRILSTEVEEVVSRLEDLLDNASDLANASDETIENFIRAMKNVDNNPEMERSSDDTMKNRIKKVISGLDEEIKRRKGTREYAERLGQERQEDRTRREEAQRRLRNIETQLANAADDSTRRRLREQRDELQGEIDNLDRNVAENDRRIDNTQRNLRGLNSNLRDLFDRENGTRIAKTKYGEKGIVETFHHFIIRLEDQKDEAGNILYTTQSKKKFEVDTHNLPAHYLYTHCYYNFRIYGEDFAKVYGVEKMSGSNIYGFE